MTPDLQSASATKNETVLRMALQNAFAQLTNLEIAMVVEAISAKSPATATAIIKDLVGPEESRAATALPMIYAPDTLADPGVVAKIMTSAANFKNAARPTKQDAMNAIHLLPTDNQASAGVLDEVSALLPDTLEWGTLGALLGKIVYAILSRRAFLFLPQIAKSVFQVTGALTLGAAGAQRAYQQHHALPLPPERGR